VTLSACVQPAELVEFFGVEGRTEHFAKRPFGKDVRSIRNLDAVPDLLDAVAERVYQLRCKIVHTKDGGGGGEIDLLLPNSREARQLGPDIDLVRLLAARVITAASAPLAT
jgi:hypothetical protein